jgi:hypothetical protein
MAAAKRGEFISVMLEHLGQGFTKREYGPRFEEKSKEHSSNCAATYNVELRQLSLFHGTVFIRSTSLKYSAKGR